MSMAGGRPSRDPDCASHSGCSANATRVASIGILCKCLVEAVVRSREDGPPTRPPQPNRAQDTAAFSRAQQQRKAPLFLKSPEGNLGDLQTQRGPNLASRVVNDVFNSRDGQIGSLGATGLIGGQGRTDAAVRTTSPLGAPQGSQVVSERRLSLDPNQGLRCLLRPYHRAGGDAALPGLPSG